MPCAPLRLTSVRMLVLPSGVTTFFSIKIDSSVDQTKYALGDILTWSLRANSTAIALYGNNNGNCTIYIHDG